MANLDPQVQMKLMDMAWEFAQKVDRRTGKYAHKGTLELFDIAYKELVKTIEVK